MEAVREYCSNPGCENHLEGGHTPVCRMCHIEEMARRGFVLMPAANCAETGAWVYVTPYRVGSRVRVDDVPGQVGYIQGFNRGDSQLYDVLMTDGNRRRVSHFRAKVIG